ncbi:Nn.00g100690.m01.CDS01 [Neocucurbitaria sp. VM-36]
MGELCPITQHEPQRSDYSCADQTNAPTSFCAILASRLHALRRCDNAPGRVFAQLPQPSRERLNSSLTDTPLDTEKLGLLKVVPQEKQKTVLYLAYGSNLCNETFRGVRGIRPLSQVNVLVPSLRLTFDLPGIPYAEPCFANTARRASAPLKHHQGQLKSEDYHKDRWHKGLVGVVYEVTLSDYAHIIATEGGGSAYLDILVDCHVLPNSDTVPSLPDSQPFKAHTLFAPVLDDEGESQQTDRVIRPDPSYAQPSARYLKLITDGAAECDLPTEYQDYLHDIRAYTITTSRQAVGKALFLSIWMPFVVLLFSLSRKLQDKKGRAPWWLGKLSAILFTGMWLSYDQVFKMGFGDGERTIGDEAKRRNQDCNSRAVAKNKDKKQTKEQGLLEAVVEMDGQKSSDNKNGNECCDMV